jgi:hypothetical protein
MRSINVGDQIKMISSNATTQHVHEQCGTVLDVDAEGRLLRVTTDAGPVLTWIVNSGNTHLIKTGSEDIAGQIE